MPVYDYIERSPQRASAQVNIKKYKKKIRVEGFWMQSSRRYPIIFFHDWEECTKLENKFKEAIIYYN
jgi:hypothetical protein